MKQNREFQNLRKDMQEMGKTLLQGQGSNLSEIKKYFEKNKSNFRERPNVGNNSNKNSDDRGLFRNMIGKLFGPSKYQQKMMDDTSQILSLTELVSSDIGFIREKYSDSARAKERELLAAAIAERINNAGGEGGGLFKGLLTAVTGLGSVLALGIGSAISGLITGIAGLAASIVAGIAALALPIGAAIAGALSGILGGIKNAIVALAKGFGGDDGTDIDIDIDKPGRQRGRAGQKRSPGEKSTSLFSRTVQSIFGSSNSKVEDAKIIRETTRSGATSAAAGGSRVAAQLAAELAAVLSMLGFGAAAVGIANMTSPEEDKIIDGMIQKEKAAEKAAEDRKKFAETDPRFEFMQKKEDAGKVKPIPGMFSESGDAMVKGADGKYYPTWSDAILAQGINFLDDSKKTLSDGIKKWTTEAISNIDEFVNPMVDKAVAFVDEAFQLPINVNGKTEILDLAPGLGTATAKVLKDIASETADLVGAGMDKAGDVITQINNNSNQTASAPMPFSAATPKSVHEATMDLYKIYYGKIR
jgi:hypothetical protein